MDNQEQLSASALDQKQVDEAIKQISEQPIEQQAVMFLRDAIPNVKELIYKQSGAVVKRVFARLMADPFETSEFKGTMGDDKELHFLATQITNSKFILFEKSLKDKLSKDSAANVATEQQQVSTPVEANQESKEIENGKVE